MADKKNQDRLKLSEDPAANLPLVKINFIMMAIAGALIVLGFLLMLGSDSGETFNPDIFSTRRTVIGPAISLIGYVAMGAAIMWKSGSRKKDNK